jgi:hypothetical protein
LTDIKSNTQLLIAGHSLGGNLAGVLAPWVVANAPAFGGSSPVSSLPSSMQVITFAAPTAGNSAFATFLNNQKNYQPYFNYNDIVPHVWGTVEPLDANDIQNMYTAQGGPACPGWVWTQVSNKLQAIANNKIAYYQTFTNATFFTGKIQSGPDGNWMDEMSYQHNTAYAVQFGG